MYCNIRKVLWKKICKVSYSGKVICGNKVSEEDHCQNIM